MSSSDRPECPVSIVYILAKNEEANIERALVSVRDAGLDVVVLDSGSTDRTLDIIKQFDNAKVEKFNYKNHCDSYNQILQRHDKDEFVMIIDADIRFSPSIVTEVGQVLSSKDNIESVIAPVTMYWGGRPLKYCSLYPPKPFVFRGGRPLFESLGHGEKLSDSVKTVTVGEHIVHDDQKPFETAIQSQIRYANNLVIRSKSGGLNWRDRIRMRFPFMLLITPIYAYLFRLGILDGKAGVLYSLDRLLFETLAYRAAVVDQMSREEDQSN